MLPIKKYTSSFLLLTTIALGLQSCEVFKNTKCDRCPQFTEVNTTTNTDLCENEK